MKSVISIQVSGSQKRASSFFTIIVSAGFILTGTVNTLAGPLLPILALRWTLSDSQAGYFFTAQFLGSIAGVSLSSFLAARRGFRFTIGFSYLLMAFGVSALELPEWKYALMGAAILGVGFGAAIPATNLFISHANQRRRASALSLVNLFWGIGAVLSPVAIYAATRHNRVSLFLMLLSLLLICFAASLVLISDANLASATKPIEPQPISSEWKFITVLGAMFFLYVAIESTAGGWIATLAKRVSANGSGKWILAPSLFWGGLLAGRGLAPLALRRFSERQVAIAGLIAAGLSMCILIISHEWQWIITAGLVVGLGLAVVFPITVALLSRFQHTQTARAGPMFALAGLGGATMPWLTGVISTWTGSLKAGLLVPLLGTAILIWLHVIGNHGSHSIE